MHSYFRNTIPEGSNKGFTLVEAIIALCILSFGLLAITAMQLNSSVNVRRAGTSTAALAAGTQVMERLMSRSFTDLLTPSVEPNPGTESVGNYTVNWAITNPGPAPNTASVAVTVTAPSGQTVTLSSVKADMNL